MAGIMPVGELGHAMESLLEAAAEHRTQLVRQDMPLLERGFDRLHTMITRVGDRRAISMPDALIEAFDARAKGREYTLPLDAPAPAPVLEDVVEDVVTAPVHDTVPEAVDIVAEAPVEAAPAFDGAEAGEAEATTPVADADATEPSTLPTAAPRAATGLRPLSTPLETATSSDDDAALRGTQEQVRVRAELLDRLVNYAGEVAIYRSRLEQQLGAFRGATAEMEQTNIRLRDQLRRLEIETEAQIIARYQRAGEDTAESDLRSARARSLQHPATALARAGRNPRPTWCSLHGSMDDLTQPVRNPAAATVAGELRIAGRPHAHAHGAVRCRWCRACAA